MIPGLIIWLAVESKQVTQFYHLSSVQFSSLALGGQGVAFSLKSHWKQDRKIRNEISYIIS